MTMQMIYSAIDGLDEEKGSNKTSISKYIESKYPNLPAGHTTLLRHHLVKMKDSGELIFWKNNYMRPNPNFIRRGRGRPPKPKGPGVPISPYRHKNKDHHHRHHAPPFPFSSSSSSSAAEAGPVVAKKVTVSSSLGFGGSGRPRGRPRKTPQPAVDGSSGLDMSSSGVGLAGSRPPAAGQTGIPRPRGRPPKYMPSTSLVPDFGFNVNH
ncbi:hypothetical protein Dimus_022018 [Dionaea muscipula]